MVLEYNLIEQLPLTTINRPSAASIGSAQPSMDDVIIFPFVEQEKGRKIEPDSVKKLVLVSYNAIESPFKEVRSRY